MWILYQTWWGINNRISFWQAVAESRNDRGCRIDAPGSHQLAGMLLAARQAQAGDTAVNFLKASAEKLQICYCLPGRGTFLLLYSVASRKMAAGGDVRASRFKGFGKPHAHGS